MYKMLMFGFIKVCQLVLVVSLFATTAIAKESVHTSEYAGQQNQSIKSLSPNDIAELKAGSGWGLAKAAELNGVPGPRHLLEMKAEIGLSQDQIDAIEMLFSKMNTAAIMLGEELIEKEEQLELRFQKNVPTPEELKSMLNELGEIRSELRYVHLSAHLETPSILSTTQIEKYNRLRGYTSADPCENIPEGHNETMWKKHNNCEM